MAQPLQTQTIAVLAAPDGQPVPRHQWPDVARRYAADRAMDATAERQRDLEGLREIARQQQQDQDPRAAALHAWKL